MQLASQFGLTTEDVNFRHRETLAAIFSPKCQSEVNLFLRNRSGKDNRWVAVVRIKLLSSARLQSKIIRCFSGKALADSFLHQVCNISFQVFRNEAVCLGANAAVPRLKRKMTLSWILLIERSRMRSKRVLLILLAIVRKFGCFVACSLWAKDWTEVCLDT